MNSQLCAQQHFLELPCFLFILLYFLFLFIINPCHPLTWETVQRKISLFYIFFSKTSEFMESQLIQFYSVLNNLPEEVFKSSLILPLGSVRFFFFFFDQFLNPKGTPFQYKFSKRKEIYLTLPLTPPPNFNNLQAQNSNNSCSFFRLLYFTPSNPAEHGSNGHKPGRNLITHVSA